MEKESYKTSLKIKLIGKLEIIAIIQVLYHYAAHSICNLKFNVPNEISVVFRNDSNYDYHFIIKELGNAFEGKFECLGENRENFKTFSVQIEKEVTKIDKDGNEIVVTISYKINFIHSARFTATTLSNFVDNLTEEIHKIKCKFCDFFLDLKVSRII